MYRGNSMDYRVIELGNLSALCPDMWLTVQDYYLICRGHNKPYTMGELRHLLNLWRGIDAIERRMCAHEGVYQYRITL